MKNKSIISVLVIGVLMVIWSCNEKQETKEKTETYVAVNTEATDASCNITSETFNSWFKSGIASENGLVNNANSVDFIHNVNCDFYKWSEQMFLWITSATNNQTTMESPVFYTISPLRVVGSDTIREFIPHTEGTTLRAFTNVDKTDQIESEEGQATDDVLMDRYGNLVYYISFGNDVYAQFLTAVKTGKMTGDTFPTTATDLDSIVNFAKANNVTLKDPNALAIELKTSWILASSLPNPSDFITVDAIVPTYSKTDTQWDITGKTTEALAMVGMHIVGSASGHPEMIWATFEHLDNTPDAAYQYIDSGGKTITVPADGDGDWIFNSDVSQKPNVSHMTFKNNAIVANSGFTISPSNTTLEKPWGTSYNIAPNDQDSTPAAANTTVINLNNSVASLLPGNDVRKNYQFIGATWTDSGTAPNGSSYSPTNTVKGVAIGTSQLANSTMETYFQHGPDYAEYSSCFTCHNNNNGLKPTDLSHVFSKIQPLINETLSVNE